MPPAENTSDIASVSVASLLAALHVINAVLGRVAAATPEPAEQRVGLGS